MGSRSTDDRERRDALHPRNRHQGRYDFKRLVRACKPLEAFLIRMPAGTTSIDFSDPRAVRLLNRALLAADYGIAQWELPEGYLCPPIPGRADYVHALADLLAESRSGTIPRGPGVRLLDIGTGASAIYPLVAHAEYGWHVLGSDIDATALRAAETNVHANRLDAAIELRRQASHTAIFEGVVRAGERFDATLCNPPFHASAADAARGSARKWRNLGRGGSARRPALNFGGQSNELWCKGGEVAFVGRMIDESVAKRDQVLWFTSLVATSDHLRDLRARLARTGAVDVREIPMSQGAKQSRFLAWTFHAAAQRMAWGD
ncbi:23S rRNA (adenine(1618)-N(6))-methyltransferase RlmF [Dokdonella sp. MW10]|uniref:23S rRNA (adenine(1618)-N(6))-methyltransferase RlmF n=1 Tax=Dokdonella sp. MW10 TaxID=2992926 RepID=UPI003F8129F6